MFSSSYLKIDVPSFVLHTWQFRYTWKLFTLQIMGCVTDRWNCPCCIKLAPSLISYYSFLTRWLSCQKVIIFERMALFWRFINESTLGKNNPCILGSKMALRAKTEQSFSMVSPQCFHIVILCLYGTGDIYVLRIEILLKVILTVMKQLKQLRRKPRKRILTH